MLATRWKQRFQYWSTIGLNHLPPYRGQSVYVLGHPRTGTNWLCWILSHYLEIPVYLRHLQGGPVPGPLILHLHRFAIVPRRTVYTLRDGRDVVVSYYFKGLNSLPTRNPAVLKALERYCHAPLVPENARLNLPGLIRFLAEANTNASVSYQSHVRKALRMGLYIVRYEDLLAHGEETLAGAVQYLNGEEASLERVRAALEATSFERITGRMAGEEDPLAPSARKGIVGDWRNYFSREAAETFDHYAGEALIEAGYELDHDWVGELSD